MNILILDNYDSFTHNLYQLTGGLVEKRMKQFSLTVKRNNELSAEDIRRAGYSHIIISPGPGSPSEIRYFGVCGDVLTSVSRTIPTLGVCLGLQGIAHFFGGEVVPSSLPMHGKTSVIEHDGRGIFIGVPQKIEVMRYHSLIVNSKKIPKELIVTGSTIGLQREIMGLRHTIYPIEGVQFHPESFATEGGQIMMSNFLFRKGRQ